MTLDGASTLGGGGRLLRRATFVASPKVHLPAALQRASASASSDADA